MKKKIIRAAVVTFIVFGLSSNVVAGTWMDFNENQFKQAQDKGQSIVLDFYADWCSSCITQKAVLKELLNEPDFNKLVVFAVNYDEFADLKTKLQVDSQGTLIVYKGFKEVARGFGIIKKNEIKALAAKGL